jgi:hypothetical protein
MAMFSNPWFEEAQPAAVASAAAARMERENRDMGNLLGMDTNAHRP